MGRVILKKRELNRYCKREREKMGLGKAANIDGMPAERLNQIGIRYILNMYI